MSQTTGKTRKSVQVFVSAMLLGGLATYYFWGFIPQQSRKLLAHQSRQLVNLHKNLDSELQKVHQWIEALKPPDSLNIESKNYKKTIPRSQSNLITWLPKKHDDAVEQSQQYDPVTGKLSIRHKTTDSLYPVWSKGLHEFLNPFVETEEFEGYVVFYNNKVCFESFPSGIVRVHPDSLTSDATKSISTKTLHLNLRGEPYLGFVEPWAINSNEVLYIVAFQKQANFEAATSKLPQAAVIFLVVLAIGAIILLPWLRIYFSGNAEQLEFRHYWQLYVSTWVIMALFAYVNLRIWKEYQYNQARASQCQQAMEEVGKEWKKYIDTIGKQLQHAKQQAIALQLYSDSSWNGKQISKQSTDEEELELVHQLLPIGLNSDTSDFQRLFFLRASGDEWFSVNKGVDRTANANFSNRAYFKNAQKAGDESSSSLEYVKSWLDGAKRLVVAQKFRNGEVAAISLDVNQTFPQTHSNFQYAIIDAEGLVIFHSNNSRELNENLLDETGNNEKLKFLLEKQKSDKFTGTYHQKAILGFIKPLALSNWSLVVLSPDLPYEHAMSNSFYFMLLLSLGLLFVQTVVLYLVKYVGSKPYFAQPQQRVVTWILPNRQNTVYYIFSGIYHLLLLAGLFINYRYRIYAFPTSALLVGFMAGLLGIFQLQLSFFIKHFHNKTIYWLKLKPLLFLFTLMMLSAVILYAFYQQDFGLALSLCVAGALLLAVGFSFLSQLYSHISLPHFATGAFSFVVASRLFLVGFAPAAILYLQASRLEFTSISENEKPHFNKPEDSFSSSYAGIKGDFWLWNRLRFNGQYEHSLELNQYEKAVNGANASVKHPADLLLLLTVSLLSILSLTWLINNVLRRMSGNIIPDYQKDNWTESEQFKFLFTSNTLLILEGLPGTNKLSFFKLKAHIQTNGDLIQVDLFGANTTEKVRICFEKAMLEASTHARWILIKNFEQYPHLSGLTQAKFEQLSQLLQIRDHHIAILTCKSLTQMSEAAGVDEGELAYMFNKFIVVSVGFSTNKNLPESLQKECQFGTYLGNLAESANYWMPHYDYLKGHQKERAILVEIQWRALHYYHAIWESLSFEEKLLTYDLASDQLVHCGPTSTVGKLMKKGLIVRNEAGRFSLFNKSFAVHILSSISESDANKIRSHVQITGIWESIKVPLLFSSGVLLAFLAGSKQELLQQTEQQLAAYVTAGALLWKMLGYLGNPFSK